MPFPPSGLEGFFSRPTPRDVILSITGFLATSGDITAFSSPREPLRHRPVLPRPQPVSHGKPLRELLLVAHQDDPPQVLLQPVQLVRRRSQPVAVQAAEAL